MKGWSVTLNDEEREVRGWATPIVVLLAAPAMAVVMAAVLLVLVAVMCALPAMAVGYILGKPVQDTERESA